MEMDRRVKDQIRDMEMVSLQISRGEARIVQKMIADSVLKAQTELDGIRTNNVQTMPPQLVNQSVEDRRYQIDPWCSLVMRLVCISDTFLDAIADD